MYKKAILTPETVNAYIDFHKKMKLPFTMSISNYTTHIKSNLHDIYFMKTQQPLRVFAAYSKIKKDCTRFEIPKLKIDDLQYFSYSFKDTNFYADTIFNIDIKAAYATILYNDGYITKKTFDYVNRLPKMQRLAALGMLAGRKEVFDIDENGDFTREETIISPTSNYFFHCVKRTSEIINECAQYLGNAFLFSWVDGIYFLQDEQASNNAGQLIVDFLKNEKKLKCTFEKLTEFEVNVKKNYFKCTYLKDGEKKVMNVPKLETAAARKIINHLKSKNGHS